MEAPLAIVDKRRTHHFTEVMHVIGDVHGRTCVILDDIVDTAGTLIKTVDALLKNGATAVYAAPRTQCSLVQRRTYPHALKELIVTNTIPLREDAAALDKIKVLSDCRPAGRASKAFTWRLV